jgi:hypothetical protein
MISPIWHHDERAVEQLLAEWKQAEERACEAEVALYRAYVDFASGDGPAPCEAQRKTAATLRAEARDKYKRAMTAVDQILADADERSRRW